MKLRTLELRGLPALLMLGVFVVIAIGIVALVLMVGAAVAVAGLALSAGAALFYALRRKLSPGTKPEVWLKAEQPSSTSSLEVREIEVEVLPQKEQ
jgi:membrane associated rhomboid family serine protease